MKIHLIVLQHGLWGTPYNLEELEREIGISSKATLEARGAQSPQGIRIFNSHSSFFMREGSHSTMDGVDECGERLFDAVRGHIQVLKENQGEEVTHLSMVGYSLGGLIARYAVGKMECEGWFHHVIPVNFLTIASPHLGVWKNPCNSWFFAPTWNFFVPKMASLTGRQLTFSDKDYGGRPLLINLADPALHFFKGLSKFKNKVCSANIHFDLGVPWATAAIATDDPYETTRKFFKGAKSLPIDPDNFPSIRQPYPKDQLLSPQSLPDLTPEQPEIKGSKFRTTFLCLLPVLSPLIAYALIRYSIKGMQHCQSLMKERPEPPSTRWLLKENPMTKEQTTDLGVMKPEGSHRGYSSLASTDDVTVKIEEVSKMKAATMKMPSLKPLDHISWMSDQLNTLQWKKIDVDCREMHAHAGIVVRMKTFAIRDHLKYMVSQLDF